MAIEIVRVTNVDTEFEALVARCSKSCTSTTCPSGRATSCPAGARPGAGTSPRATIACSCWHATALVPAGFMAAAIRRNPGLFDETYCQLEDAYVREAGRRAGLGADMLQRVEAWSRSRGVDEVRLGVVAANDLGLSFWRKSGFVPLTYTMSKTLAGAAK